MRREIAARPTNVIESMASFTPSARIVASAALRTSARETLKRRMLDEMSIASPRGGLFTQALRAHESGARVLGICLDDLAHESVAHDVAMRSRVIAGGVSAVACALGGASVDGRLVSKCLPGVLAGAMVLIAILVSSLRLPKERLA